MDKIIFFPVPIKQSHPIWVANSKHVRGLLPALEGVGFDHHGYLIRLSFGQSQRVFSEKVGDELLNCLGKITPEILQKLHGCLLQAVLNEVALFTVPQELRNGKGVVERRTETRNVFYGSTKGSLVSL